VRESVSYWTKADQAEVEVLINELVEEWWGHDCDGDPCPHLAVALDVVESWMQRRLLKSRASYLRELEWLETAERLAGS
jgi:hypothetical protein